MKRMTNGRPRATDTVTWPRLLSSFRGLLARCLLLCFTLFLALRIDSRFSFSWWIVFAPLWLFHAAVARHRFSFPAPAMPHGRQWAPCHSVVAVPLLLSFEILLCIFLENMGGVNEATEKVLNLKIVFLPLLAFEMTVLVDNFRMCRALMPIEDENISEEAVWETLPHFWVAISMVFLVAATSFLLLKLSGEVGALGWWDLFINFGIAECFSFLVCTKWYNPTLQRLNEAEGHNEDSLCGLQDIGGHAMKIPIVVFQILLCMRLEGKPASVRNMPATAIFLPIFLLQGAGILFASWRLLEKLFVVISSRSLREEYIAITSRIYECFAFFHHGSRLLGWWSIDEQSKEEQASTYHAAGSNGYNTFSLNPPEAVRKMPRKELTEEIWRLQEALCKQTQISKYTQQEHARIRNDRIVCRICFEEDITIVLLPCRHCTLCKSCADKCKICPICRVPIDERLLLADV